MKLTVQICAALAFACVAVLVAPIAPAFAQAAAAAANVVGANNPDLVEWGNGVVAVGETVATPVKTTLTLVIMGVILKYAGPFGMLVRQSFVADLVDKAVDFAFAATAGAQRGKVLDINTMPEFMRNVLRYANGHFPWVLRWVIKNTQGLVEMALARMVAEIPAEFQYKRSFANDNLVGEGGFRLPKAA